MLGRLIDIFLKRAPLKQWALLGAGFITLVAMEGFAVVIWLGDWPPSAHIVQARLDYLGSTMLLMASGQLIVVIAFAAVSARFRGPAGISFEVGGDEPRAAAEVVTKTTVTAAPAAAKEEP